MVVAGSGTPLQPLVAMLIQMFFLLVVLKMAPCELFFSVYNVF